MRGDGCIKRLGGKNNDLAGMSPSGHWVIESSWPIQQPHKGKSGGNRKFS